MAEHEPIDAVLTTLSIIEQLADADGPLGVSEIASAIGSTKPRVYRHLRTLLERRYVMQDPASDKYQLSLRLFHLSQSIPEKTSFVREARTVLPALRDMIQQTVAIGVIEEDGIRVVEILRHRSAIQITTPPGTLFAFHSSAQGKVALAFGAVPGSSAVDHKATGSAGRRPLPSAAQLRKELAQIQAQGWAVAPETVLLGVNALAAPVFDAGGKVCGTIAVVGSVQYVSPQPDGALVSALTTAAGEISHRLGYTKHLEKR
ncbi:MAG: IclR family transcriptional regulator [Gammaproteobacteria bacterium]|nr:IclR family transcriptional regulator [Gammaproteobacteria bacterium]